MTYTTHDPSEYIRNIYQILINNKKRIGFLFGAGTSLAVKDNKSLRVPAMKELTSEITNELLNIKDNGGNQKYKKLINSISTELKNKFNIETFLSKLEQIHEFIGDISHYGLNKNDFKELITKIKQSIKIKTSVHLNEPVDYNSLIQSDFANWIGQADRAFGIEIFTLNYDYLFELGLEHCNISYYDGFTGSYKPFFYSESIEKLNYLTAQTKLWKIHGSIGWHEDDVNNKIIRFNSDKNDIIIYPSIYKYRNSKKQPYISLLDRLSNFLKQEDSVLFTCGYSFGDEHINERIISSLNTDINSHVIALYWDEYFKDKTPHYHLDENSDLFNIANSNGKISILGFKSAIIGRQLGKWKLRKEPEPDETPNINLYFDEDAYNNPNEELNKESIGTEKWSGLGKFLLPNFVHFVKFLNSMIQENYLSKTS